MIKPLGNNVLIGVETSSESETASGLILKTNKVKIRLKLVELGSEVEKLSADTKGKYVEVRAAQFQRVQKDEDSPAYLIGPETSVIGVYDA